MATQYDNRSYECRVRKSADFAPCPSDAAGLGVPQNREYGMETEVPSVNRVDEIHEKLASLQGERLKVKANMGRSRIVERTGTLVMAYPSLFQLEVDERRGRKARQSYQYVDVLTGMVELSQNGEPLFEPFIPEGDEPGVDMSMLEEKVLS